MTLMTDRRYENLVLLQDTGSESDGIKWFRTGVLANSDDATKQMGQAKDKMKKKPVLDQSRVERRPS